MRSHFYEDLGSRVRDGEGPRTGVLRGDAGSLWEGGFWEDGGDTARQCQSAAGPELCPRRWLAWERSRACFPQ